MTRARWMRVAEQIDRIGWVLVVDSPVSMDELRALGLPTALRRNARTGRIELVALIPAHGLPLDHLPAPIEETA